MMKKIGNVLLTFATVVMLLYLIENLPLTQLILALLHFAFLGLLIYTVACGFGEVNKRLDKLTSQPREDKHVDVE